MLTVNQRDILAGVITARFIDEDARYEDWIEEYELHRKRIAEYDEQGNNTAQDKVSP